MMYLKQIIIEHYKSFFTKQKIPFAIPNGENGSGLTVIVGPNNVGKSTIFESLRKLFPNVEFDLNERHHGKDVRIVYINSKKEEKVIRTEGSALGVVSNPDVFPKPQNLYYISSRRHWNSQFNGSHNRKHHLETILYKGIKNAEDTQIALGLREVAKDNAKKESFNESMRLLIPEFKNWQIELENGVNYILYETESGQNHRVDFMGDGAISLFKIVYHLRDADDNQIIVIDEPELSLHPNAQKNLAKMIALKSSNSQIFVATHCPHFVRWIDIQNGAKIIRVNKFKDKQSTIHRLMDDKKYSKKMLSIKTSDWEQPHLLDAVAKEFFFSNNILIVEGQEDVGLLKKFAYDNNIELNFDFFGYGAGGSGNIFNLLAVANDLGIKAGAIYDGDRLGDYNKSLRKFPNYKILKLKTDDIRDKPESNGKPRKLGIFFKNGKIKKMHKKYLIALLNKLNRYFLK